MHYCAYLFIYLFADITESNINKEYMDAGLSFPRNRDIDGKTILVLKSKLHIRGARDNEQLFRIFIYWIERLNRYYLNNNMNGNCIKPCFCCVALFLLF